MSNEKIKKENQKAMKKYIFIVLACGIMGAIAGCLSNMGSVQEIGESFKDWIAEACYIASPYGVILCNVGTVIAGLYFYKRAKRLNQKCGDGDDSEEEYNYIDGILSKGMIFLNMGMIVSYGFFACWIVNFTRYREEPDKSSMIMAVVVVSVFAVGIFGSVKITQLIVDFMRTMNPRLSGSIYDRKFHDKWEESCDELEKLMIYKSAYHAFRVTNRVCILGWSTMVILGLFYGTGPLPPVIITAIWGVLNYSYYCESYRLEHKTEKNRKGKEK